MTIVKVFDPKRCPDILPVRTESGSGIFIEKRCVLPLGHPGFHRDLHGAHWVNQHDLLRQRGIGMGDI